MNWSSADLLIVLNVTAIELSRRIARLNATRRLEERRVSGLKLARFRGQCEIGGQAADSMYRRSNSTGEMNPIDV
jgi:hypothetical protein